MGLFVATELFIVKIMSALAAQLLPSGNVPLARLERGDRHL
jgi:hypothetical protein